MQGQSDLCAHLILVLDTRYGETKRPRPERDALLIPKPDKQHFRHVLSDYDSIPRYLHITTRLQRLYLQKCFCGVTH